MILGNVWRHFWLPQLQRVWCATGFQWVGTRDTAKPPVMLRTPPDNKVIWPQMSVGPRLRNSVLRGSVKGYENSPPKGYYLPILKCKLYLTLRTFKKGVNALFTGIPTSLLQFILLQLEALKAFEFVTPGVLSFLQQKGNLLKGRDFFFFFCQISISLTEATVIP